MTEESTLRPFRGTKGKAIENLTVENPLKEGEIFFEYPDTGVGTGGGKIKMGDGETAYDELPYFFGGDEQIEQNIQEVWDSMNILGAKNLLENTSLESGEYDGVVVTLRDDGSINVNGTSPNNGVLFINGSDANWAENKYVGMILNGSPEFSSAATYSLEVFYYNTASEPKANYIKNVYVSSNEDYEIEDYPFFVVAIQYMNNIIMNNVMFRPMIRPATFKDTTFAQHSKTNRELTENVENLVETLTDEANDVMFKFGINSDGDYGYYKKGETTVTPFKSRHTETITPNSRATVDMGLYHNIRYVDLSAVPNVNGLTFTPTTRADSIDMGVDNKYRYVNTTSVPNANSETYPATARAASIDMGYTNTYRYVNTANVPNTNSSTYGPITVNGTHDMNSPNYNRWVNVDVKPIKLGTYSEASIGGDTITVQLEGASNKTFILSNDQSLHYGWDAVPVWCNNWCGFEYNYVPPSISVNGNSVTIKLGYSQMYKMNGQITYDSGGNAPDDVYTYHIPVTVYYI